jgi:glycosyltransferase involved in cell wall biosynthesis
MNPYFTVIIPTFNREHLIARAIKSVQDQTNQDWECIIVDDASNDNTEHVVREFIKNDSRIRYIKNKINKERCVSRNIGIQLAEGKYICFLDSDDYHLENHLEHFYNEIERHRKIENHEPIGFFFSNSWNETEDGTRSERFCPDYTATEPYTYFLKYTVNPQRWCVHRSIFKHVFFDPEVTICEDMDTSLRILAKGYLVKQIPKRTTVYVATSDSFTHGDPNKATKELFYLNKIFNKPELKPHLSKREQRRLLSMCYYHIGQKAIREKQRGTFYKHALYSFILCPNGYNGKTNKILLVNAFYQLPILGRLMKYLISKTK